MRGYLTGAAESVGNTAGWVASFFYTAAPKEKKLLCLCTADYLFDENRYSGALDRCPSVLAEETTLQKYLEEGRFVKDGYTSVQLANFDFTKTTCSDILNCNLSQFVFVQVTFGIEQLKQLIARSVDLSGSTYRLSSPISLEVYSELYQDCVKTKNLASLHGVCVDFSRANLQGKPDDFLVSCTPHALQNTIVTQQQFDLLMESAAARHQALDLRYLVLRDLDITQLITICSSRVTFDDRSYHPAEKRVCLAGTRIYGAKIDFDVLATLVNFAGFSSWFDSNPAFTVYFEDGLQVKECPIIVTDVLESADYQCKRQSRLPRFMDRVKDTLPERIVALLRQKKVPGNDMLDAKHMTQGEQFLWMSYCAKFYPEEKLSEAFWQAVNYKQGLQALLTPRLK